MIHSISFISIRIHLISNSNSFVRIINYLCERTFRINDTIFLSISIKLSSYIILYYLSFLHFSIEFESIFFFSFFPLLTLLLYIRKNKYKKMKVFSPTLISFTKNEKILIVFYHLFTINNNNNNNNKDILLFSKPLTITIVIVVITEVAVVT